MAQALDLSVTAEGIETAEQLAILNKLGCHRGQGFLLGHPHTAAAMERLVARR
jgi:EAL domain-containing protein (putative c-di-GMP-specific phosphodiesterase class I)